MPESDKNIEAPKKPSVSESVQSMIDKKKSERESEVGASAAEKAEGTQQEVAEVLGGAEKPSEKVSERASEKGDRDVAAKGGGSSDEDQAAAVSINLKDYTFPSEEVMVKKIRTAINAQIKEEWKNAIKFKKRLTTGGAADYNRSIARIRNLKEILGSLYTATKAFMKNLYTKYFTPDGNRREF